MTGEIKGRKVKIRNKREEKFYWVVRNSFERLEERTTNKALEWLKEDIMVMWCMGMITEEDRMDIIDDLTFSQEYKPRRINVESPQFKVV